MHMNGAMIAKWAIRMDLQTQPSHTWKEAVATRTNRANAQSEQAEFEPGTQDHHTKYHIVRLDTNLDAPPISRPHRKYGHTTFHRQLAPSRTTRISTSIELLTADRTETIANWSVSVSAELPPPLADLSPGSKSPH
jgi:hypothetical protein